MALFSPHPSAFQILHSLSNMKASWLSISPAPAPILPMPLSLSTEPLWTASSAQRTSVLLTTAATMDLKASTLRGDGRSEALIESVPGKLRPRHHITNIDLMEYGNFGEAWQSGRGLNYASLVFSFVNLLQPELQ